MASAYEQFVSEKDDAFDPEGMKIAKKVRDVVVVLCIRFAGTHKDQDTFEKAVLDAFRKPERPQQENSEWSRVYSQIFLSYHRLLTVEDGGFESKSHKHRPNGRKAKPSEQTDSAEMQRGTSVEQQRSRPAEGHQRGDAAGHQHAAARRCSGAPTWRARSAASPCTASLVRRMEANHRAEREQWNSEREQWNSEREQWISEVQQLKAMQSSNAVTIQGLQAIVQQWSVRNAGLENRVSQMEDTMAALFVQFQMDPFQFQ
jgi:hypothetical protein